MTNPLAGAAADAIRTAEASLARQNSVAAQVDLQVVAAVLNAHAAHGQGAADLDRLQGEIEAAVATRTDLDTPAGARAFQHYLIDKLRDIRTVVEDADLDATSKASLAAALSSLYASETPDEKPVPASSERTEPPAARPSGTSQPEPAPITGQPADYGLADLDLGDVGGELPPLDGEAPSTTAQPDRPAPPPTAAPANPPPPMPSFGAMPSAGLPLGGGLSPFQGAGLPDLNPRRSRGIPHEQTDPGADRAEEADPERSGPDPADAAVAVRLPDGQTITAPTRDIAEAISSAVAGTPIPDAFRQQGITLPAPGSPVIDPIEPAGLRAGDIGVLSDRHALALGNGTALLDQRIQPVASVNGPGFIGWRHPPEPDRGQPSPLPEAPAPDQPATAH